MDRIDTRISSALNYTRFKKKPWYLFQLYLFTSAHALLCCHLHFCVNLPLHIKKPTLVTSDDYYQLQFVCNPRQILAKLIWVLIIFTKLLVAPASNNWSFLKFYIHMKTRKLKFSKIKPIPQKTETKINPLIIKKAECHTFSIHLSRTTNQMRTFPLSGKIDGIKFKAEAESK